MTTLNVLPSVKDFAYADLGSKSYAAGSTSMTLPTGEGAWLPDPEEHAGGSYQLLLYKKGYTLGAIGARRASSQYAFLVTVTRKVGDTLTVSALPYAVGPNWAAQRALSRNDIEAIDAKLAFLENQLSLGRFLVKEFGAKGDGVTDDTAATQDAIDAARDQTDYAGGIVQLPPGRFMTSAPLVIPDDEPIYIIGAGNGASQIVSASGLSGTNLIENAGLGQDGFSLERLYLQTHSSSGHAIHATNIKGLRIHDCWIFSRGQSENYDPDETGSNDYDGTPVAGGLTTWRAAIRAEDVIKSNIDLLRVKGTSAVAFWFGKASDGATPITTNHQVSRIYNYNINSGQGFKKAFLFLDNAGNWNQRDSKIDGVEATWRTWIRDGQAHRFDGVGYENQANGTGDLRLQGGCRLLTFRNCGIGHPTEAPKAVDADDAKCVSFERCNFSGDIDVDSSCDEVTIENSVGRDVTFSGTGKDYPTLKRRNFRRVDSSETPLDSPPGAYSNVIDMEIIRDGSDLDGDYQAPSGYFRSKGDSGSAGIVGVLAAALGSEEFRNGELELWIDPANGNLRAKAKDNAGNVRNYTISTPD